MHTAHDVCAASQQFTLTLSDTWVIRQPGYPSFNSLLSVSGKFSAVIRTLFYDFGSLERHFKFMIKRYTPLLTQYQRNTLFVVGVSN